MNEPPLTLRQQIVRSLSIAQLQIANAQGESVIEREADAILQAAKDTFEKKPVPDKFAVYVTSDDGQGIPIRLQDWETDINLEIHLNAFASNIMLSVEPVPEGE
jgi:plasmid stability protein